MLNLLAPPGLRAAPVVQLQPQHLLFLLLFLRLQVHHQYYPLLVFSCRTTSPTTQEDLVVDTRHT